MATPSSIHSITTNEERTSAIDRVAAGSSLCAGISGFLYALSFIVLKNSVLIALFLMLGGLFATLALSMLYSHVKTSEATLALWAWILGIGGAFGGVLHGGYDLANAINPPAGSNALASLPSPIDPRGLLTFGIAGLGFFAFAWLMGRNRKFPRTLMYLTYLLATLLLVLYLVRLIIVDAKNPLIVIVAVVSGFIVNPLWYIWLSSVLWRGNQDV